MTERRRDTVEMLDDVLERLAATDPNGGPRTLAELLALQATLADSSLLVRQLLGIEPVPGAVPIVAQHIGTMIDVLNNPNCDAAARGLAEMMLSASWSYLISLRRVAADEARQARLEAYDEGARTEHVHEARATPYESDRYPGAFVHECECGAVGISSAASGGKAIWGRERVEVDE